MNNENIVEQLNEVGVSIKRAFLWLYLNLAFCVIMIILSVYNEQYIFTAIFCLLSMYAIYILNRNINNKKEYEKTVEKYQEIKNK